MVEDVEELRSELECLAFRDRNVFENGEVPVRIARPLRDVAAGITELCTPSDRPHKSTPKTAMPYPPRNTSGAKKAPATVTGTSTFNQI